MMLSNLLSRDLGLYMQKLQPQKTSKPVLLDKDSLPDLKGIPKPNAKTFSWLANSKPLENHSQQQTFSITQMIGDLSQALSNGKRKYTAYRSLTLNTSELTIHPSIDLPIPGFELSPDIQLNYYNGISRIAPLMNPSQNVDSINALVMKEAYYKEQIRNMVPEEEQEA